ncbi:MAG: hypothetical protein ACK44H_07825, partial [Candidatus Kryptonium sp.]
MKLFPSGEKLKPFWVFRTPGDFKIWKVFPTRYDKVLCELRNLEKRNVKFVCLSTENGVKIWEDLNIDEPWW